MALVGIDATNDKNFEGQQFKLLPKGVYTFEVTGENGQPLALSQSKSSNNQIIKLELHCIDDAGAGEYKGAIVFDNLVLVPKAEFKIIHLALASGKYTKEQLKASKDATGRAQIDTTMLDHAIVKAEIDVEAGKPYADSTGAQKPGRERNVVTRYVFEAGTAEAASAASAS